MSWSKTNVNKYLPIFSLFFMITEISDRKTDDFDIDTLKIR